MGYKIVYNGEQEPEELRAVYCRTMMGLAEKNRDIIHVDSDLVYALNMSPFLEKFPDQTVNCGIQEANMIGVAAGMSMFGFIPYAHTLAAFASRKTADQIFLSAAYAKLNVRIIGSDPGITATINGGSHMAMEDIAIMRAIPDTTVIDITDAAMLGDILAQVSDQYGIFYIRMPRKIVAKVYETGSTFEIGKANELVAGTDACIISSGICVDESLRAAEMLRKKGLQVRVLDMFTIKPIDKDAIVRAAKETGAIVTAENHNYYNGLGSAVAEVICENYPVSMERIGIKDRFGEVGDLEYLKKCFEINAEKIAEKVITVIKKK